MAYKQWTFLIVHVWHAAPRTRRQVGLDLAGTILCLSGAALAAGGTGTAGSTSPSPD